MAGAEYDVFISFKHLDEHGAPTPDSALARKVHDYLASKGLKVFFSIVTLEQLGVSAYKKAIDDALDGSRVLVAVGTSVAHLDWKWVRYEWDSFFADILSDVKPDGKVFVYLDGPDIRSLPRALRQSQCFHDGSGSLETLFKFVSGALGRGSPPVASVGTPRSKMVEPPPPSAGRRAYVSFAHADSAYVARLGDALAERGIDCHLDIAALPASDFLSVFREAIGQADVFVVVVSRNSAESGYIVAEVKKAWELRKPIVPVLLDDPWAVASSIPWLLANLNAIDARDKDVREVAAKIASALA